MISIRDYFAAAALPAVLAARVAQGLDAMQESIAEECYELADALLAAREKPSESDDDHVHCSECGKRVSGHDPELGLVVRAYVQCPECVEKHAESRA